MASSRPITDRRPRALPLMTDSIRASVTGTLSGSSRSRSFDTFCSALCKLFGESDAEIGAAEAL